MERVHIPHSGDLAPGTWHVIGGDLLRRCPLCRRTGNMLNHSIKPDGEVNASIACFPPCTYHEWGILDGWTYGEKKAGAAVSMTEQESEDGRVRLVP